MFYESRDVLSNFVFRCFKRLNNKKKFEEQTNVSFPFEMKYIYQKKRNFWDAQPMQTKKKNKISNI